MSIDVEALRQAGWERYSYLACAALILYEYFIQFSNEIDYFWRRRGSFGKWIFLWSRYYSVAYNISNAVVFMQPKPSLDLCSKFFHWQDTGAALAMVTTHIILELRLYAMYSRSRKILALLVFLILCEGTAMGVIFGYPYPGTIGTNEPFPGIFICADGDPLNGKHWVAYYWTAILCIESIFLVLSLYQAWIHRRRSEGGSMMRSLTQASATYFVLIFGVYLANQILWLKNRLTLNEIGTAPGLVISSILANRLMIDVRASYYEAEDEERLATIRFGRIVSTLPPPFSMDDGELEMTRYDDVSGF